MQKKKRKSKQFEMRTAQNSRGKQRIFRILFNLKETASLFIDLSNLFFYFHQLFHLVGYMGCHHLYFLCVFNSFLFQ